MRPLFDLDLLRTAEGQALLRQLFQSLSRGHRLSHATRQKIVRSLGLLTREDIQNMAHRLDMAEGRARRAGLLKDDE